MVSGVEYRFGASAEDQLDWGHDPGSSEERRVSRHEKLGRNGARTSSPHPLALRLAATSGVTSAYLSAALVETYQQCDGLTEDMQGGKEVLTASLPIVSTYRTWATNRNLRFLQLSRQDISPTWN